MVTHALSQCSNLVHNYHATNFLLLIELLSSFRSPSVSHTLPASGMHPRPPLETNAGHKSLKRYSSAGSDAMHLPPPDYPGDLENKPGANHLLSVDTRDLSGSRQLYSWYMSA